MTGQIELISSREAWQLDDSSRDAGRRGIERARAALGEARARLGTDEPLAAPDRAA